MHTNPHLDERDARLLARRVVEQVHKLGASVSQFGVHLEREGFYFMAVVNGRTVWARTGQGNFTYQAVAAELVDAALKAQDAPWVSTDVAHKGH